MSKKAEEEFKNADGKNFYFKVEDLINLSFGPPTKNLIHCKLIQTVLLVLARHMRILEQKVEFRDQDGATEVFFEKLSPISSSTDDKSGRVHKYRLPKLPQQITTKAGEMIRDLYERTLLPDPMEPSEKVASESTRIRETKTVEPAVIDTFDRDEEKSKKRHSKRLVRSADDFGRSKRSSQWGRRDDSSHHRRSNDEGNKPKGKIDIEDFEDLELIENAEEMLPEETTEVVDDHQRPKRHMMSDIEEESYKGRESQKVRKGDVGKDKKDDRSRGRKYDDDDHYDEERESKRGAIKDDLNRTSRKTDVGRDKRDDRSRVRKHDDDQYDEERESKRGAIKDDFKHTSKKSDVIDGRAKSASQVSVGDKPPRTKNRPLSEKFREANPSASSKITLKQEEHDRRWKKQKEEEILQKQAELSAEKEKKRKPVKDKIDFSKFFMPKSTETLETTTTVETSKWVDERDRDKFLIEGVKFRMRPDKLKALQNDLRRRGIKLNADNLADIITAIEKRKRKAADSAAKKNKPKRPRSEEVIREKEKSQKVRGKSAESLRKSKREKDGTWDDDERDRHHMGKTGRDIDADSERGSGRKRYRDEETSSSFSSEDSKDKIRGTIRKSGVESDDEISRAKKDKDKAKKDADKSKRTQSAKDRKPGSSSSESISDYGAGKGKKHKKDDRGRRRRSSEDESEGGSRIYEKKRAKSEDAGAKRRDSDTSDYRRKERGRSLDDTGRGRRGKDKKGGEDYSDEYSKEGKRKPGDYDRGRGKGGSSEEEDGRGGREGSRRDKGPSDKKRSRSEGRDRELSDEKYRRRGSSEDTLGGRKRYRDEGKGGEESDEFGEGGRKGEVRGVSDKYKDRDGRGRGRGGEEDDEYGEGGRKGKGRGDKDSRGRGGEEDDEYGEGGRKGKGRGDKDGRGRGGEDEEYGEGGRKGKGRGDKGGRGRGGEEDDEYDEVGRKGKGRGDKDGRGRGGEEDDEYGEGGRKGKGRGDKDGRGRGEEDDEYGEGGRKGKGRGDKDGRGRGGEEDDEYGEGGRKGKGRGDKGGRGRGGEEDDEYGEGGRKGKGRGDKDGRGRGGEEDDEYGEGGRKGKGRGDKGGRGRGGEEDDEYDEVGRKGKGRGDKDGRGRGGEDEEYGEGGRKGKGRGDKGGRGRGGEEDDEYDEVGRKGKGRGDKDGRGRGGEEDDEYGEGGRKGKGRGDKDGRGRDGEEDDEYGEGGRKGKGRGDKGGRGRGGEEDDEYDEVGRKGKGRGDKDGRGRGGEEDDEYGEGGRKGKGRGDKDSRGRGGEEDDEYGEGGRKGKDRGDKDGRGRGGEDDEYGEGGRKGKGRGDKDGRGKGGEEDDEYGEGGRKGKGRGDKDGRGRGGEDDEYGEGGRKGKGRGDKDGRGKGGEEDDEYGERGRKGKGRGDKDGKGRGGEEDDEYGEGGRKGKGRGEDDRGGEDDDEERRKGKGRGDKDSRGRWGDDDDEDGGAGRKGKREDRYGKGRGGEDDVAGKRRKGEGSDISVGGKDTESKGRGKGKRGSEDDTGKRTDKLGKGKGKHSDTDVRGKMDKGLSRKTSLTVSEEERGKEKVLVVKKRPSRVDSKGGPPRVGSIECVTQEEFRELEERVKKLQQMAGPLPPPLLPDNKKLRSDIAKGSASLTDAMKAMQLSARVDAAEKAVDRLADMMTQLAAQGALPPELAKAANIIKTQISGLIPKDGKDVLGFLKGASQTGKREDGKGDKWDAQGLGQAAADAAAAVAGATDGRGKAVLIDPTMPPSSRTPASGTAWSGPGFGSSAGGMRGIPSGTSAASKTMTTASQASGVLSSYTSKRPSRDTFLNPPIDLDDAIRSMRDELLTTLQENVGKTNAIAQNAVHLAKTITQKLDVAMQLDDRVGTLTTVVSEYAEQLNGFDRGLTTQLIGFHQEMSQIRADLSSGLEQLQNFNDRAESDAVMELTSQYEQLVYDLEGTVHDHLHLTSIQERLGTDLKGLLNAVENMREQKADRDEVADALKDKADLSRLEGLLRDEEFNHARQGIDNKLLACYDKFISQDKAWMEALHDFRGVVKEKAELIQLQAMRDEEQKELQELLEKVQLLTKILGEPKAAVLTRKISTDGRCAACRLPALIEAQVPSNMPQLPALRPPPAGAEDDDEQICLQEITKLDSKTHVCHRWVGGSHTVLTEAIHREKAVAEPPPSVKKYLAEGSDGKVYRLEVPMLPCEECNQEPNIPGETDSSMPKSGGGGDQVTLINVANARRVTIIDEETLRSAPVVDGKSLASISRRTSMMPNLDQPQKQYLNQRVSIATRASMSTRKSVALTQDLTTMTPAAMKFFAGSLDPDVEMHHRASDLGYIVKGRNTRISDEEAITAAIRKNIDRIAEGRLRNEYTE